MEITFENIKELSNYVDPQTKELYVSLETLSYLLGISPFEVTTHIIDLFAKKDLDPDDVCKEIVVEDGKKSLYYKLDVYIYIIFRLSAKTIGSWRQEIVNGIKKYLLNGIAINDQMLLLAKNYEMDTLLERG